LARKTTHAEKATRRAEKRRQRNRAVKGATKTYLDRARQTIARGDLAAAETATLQAIRVLDRASQKGTVHSNNAARRKSRLMKRLNALRATVPHLDP
jgi:small subunit ribosomal protein S20